MPKDPIPGYPRGNKDPRVDPSDPPPKPSKSMSEKEFAEAVRVEHNGFRAVIPTAIVSALITAIGTYFATVAAKGPSASDVQQQMATNCLTKAQFDDAMRVQNEQYNRRFDVIETDTSYLKITVRLVQDKLNAAK